MGNEKTTIQNINLLQENTLEFSREYLADILEYFEYLQETLLIAFYNSGQPLPIEDIPNNPKLFAYISAARSFSISKIAVDITIRGYPLEGMALFRTLSELTKCTEYLLIHTNLISKFLQGAIKAKEILKLAKNESDPTSEYTFGRLWGIMSRFAHATPDLLLLPLASPDRNILSAELVMNNMEINRIALNGILTQLLQQYFFFRFTFLGALAVLDELDARDKNIYNPEIIRKLANLDSIQDEQILEVYNLITQKNDDKSTQNDNSA